MSLLIHITCGGTHTRCLVSYRSVCVPVRDVSSLTMNFHMCAAHVDCTCARVSWNWMFCCYWRYDALNHISSKTQTYNTLSLWGALAPVLAVVSFVNKIKNNCIATGAMDTQFFILQVRQIHIKMHFMEYWLLPFFKIFKELQRFIVGLPKRCGARMRITSAIIIMLQ